jgi:hypothetical protein
MIFGYCTRFRDEPIFSNIPYGIPQVWTLNLIAQILNHSSSMTV